MEENGDITNRFDLQTRTSAKGKLDPKSKISELMPESVRHGSMINPWSAELTAGMSIIEALATPVSAEIVPARCRLIRYGGIETPVETFPCDFRQSGGNVQVWSERWRFDFP